MWLRPHRMLDVDAKPRFFPLGAADGGAAGRIRAAWRRREDHGGRGLPHPLRAYCGLRRRRSGHLRSQRLSAHDCPGARGSRRPPAAEPGLCGAPARRTTTPSWQEEAGCCQEEAGSESDPARLDPGPGGSAGTGSDDTRRLSLAAAATAAIARAPLIQTSSKYQPVGQSALRSGRYPSESPYNKQAPRVRRMVRPDMME
jgi:hypothetical protein